MPDLVRWEAELVADLGYRLDLARKMGATKAINVSHQSLDTAMQELGMVEGFDVGLEMSGNPRAFRDLLRTMHHGGSVALLGIPPDETAIDWNRRCPVASSIFKTMCRPSARRSRSGRG